MNSQLSNDNIVKINNIFKKYPEIQRVYLYGSRSLGNAKSGSDIDLSLVGNVSLDLFTKIKMDLDDLYFPQLFDLSVYNEIKSENLLKHINQFGIKIYP
jgi:predicted nucleotidyltransferase